MRRRMCPKNLKDLKIKKILIIGLNSTGGNLLLTPAIAKIRNTFKEAEFDIIVGLNGSEFAKDNPWFTRYIVLDKRKNIFRFLKQANKNRYDLIVNFRNSPLSFFLRAKYKMSFYRQAFFSEKNYTHESKRMLNFIAPYFGTEEDIHLYFPLSKKDRDSMEERLRLLGIKNSDLLVVLNHGTDNYGKTWPKERFISLIKEIFKTYEGVKIFIIGTVDEKTQGEEIKKLFNGNNIYNLAGETTLKELGALLEKSDMLITNASSAMYLAGAVNCPVVAIFGHTNPYRYGPIGTRNIVVHSNLDCFPCNGRKRCRKDFLCLEKISVEQVLKAVMLILDEKEQPLLFDL